LRGRKYKKKIKKSFTFFEIVFFFLESDKLLLMINFIFLILII